jgi:hypothetical protein
MTDSRVALGVDRLPWLPDEPKREPPRAKARDAGSSNLVYMWAVLAMLLVAAASYWLGMRTAGDGDVPNVSKPSATVDLPRAEDSAPLVQAPPAPEVQPAPAPEVRPVPQPSLRISSPPARRLPRTVPPAVAERVKRTMATDEIDRVAAQQEKRPAPAETKPVAAPPAPAAAKPAQPQKLTVWPARESAGASGRVVQIGAFGTRLQAKRGWTYMARAYPGVKKLPAVVVEARNSRGRRFYRFQIGTTSQAHSEVLCQRMQKIRFSCAVVGLPGQRRTVER